MSEPKFKPGMMAWSPKDGFAIVEDIPNRKHEIAHGRKMYYVDGRDSTQDVHPTLLTVEEAGRLGYYPEKKKVKKKFYQAVFKAQIAPDVLNIGSCVYGKKLSSHEQSNIVGWIEHEIEIEE